MGPLIFISGNRGCLRLRQIAQHASMGPLIFISGNIFLQANDHLHQHASMGPLIFISGNLKQLNWLDFIYMLQWGH